MITAIVFGPYAGAIVIFRFQGSSVWKERITWRSSVQPGNLAKITRASIGVPIGTIGLILGTHKVNNTAPFTDEIVYHDVQLYGLKNPRTVRRMPRDLEVISE